jgi:hypothetical protein
MLNERMLEIDRIYCDILIENLSIIHITRKKEIYHSFCDMPLQGSASAM